MSSRKTNTSLSYWFPIIEAAGIPVPKTKLVEMTDTARKMIWDAFDGKDSGSTTDPFFEEIKQAATGMGFPCFLRTDETSGKHSWKDTCFLSYVDEVPAHVMSIVEFSECADMFGLPWDTWSVREFLPTMPIGTCPRYGNMPVCREFRFFVKDGQYVCHHPYWPLETLRDGGWSGSEDDFRHLCFVENEAELIALAERTGDALGGSWSIDILETERGWFVTDLAEANKSYHWKGCENKTRGEW